MKKETIVMAAALFISTITLAQSKKPLPNNQPVVKTEQKKNEQYKNLKLTAAQQQKLNAIQLATKTTSDAIKSNASLTKEQKQQQMLMLIQSSKQQSNAVLTADQQAQLKNQKSGSRKKRNSNNY
jgi:Spy/CpxP family protein refolding chaperone